MCAQSLSVGLIGAGNFARVTVLPSLEEIDDVSISAVATATGSSAASVAQKYGCEYSTTDYRRLLDDDQLDMIVVATRHDLHADLAVKALERNRNVHVEKPLALTREELREVVDAERESEGRLMVGFNRRFAPSIRSVKRELSESLVPVMVQYRVRFDSQPDHWIHDPDEGGGRILGEVCHFVDLIAHLSDGRPERVYASRIALQNGLLPDENFHAVIDCSDGSRGHVTYTSLGDDSVPKERIEVFGQDRTHVIDNFEKGPFGIDQDKGHTDQFRAFAHAIRTESPSPIPIEELISSTVGTFDVRTSIQTREPVEVDPAEAYL